MIKNNFYIKNITREKMKEYGFKYVPYENQYIKYFPIEKYKKYTVIQGKITIDGEDGTVNIDVLTENGDIYSPYYNLINKNFKDYVNKMHRKIYAELNKYPIKKKGRKHEKTKSKKTNRDSKNSNKGQ